MKYFRQIVTVAAAGSAVALAVAAPGEAVTNQSGSPAMPSAVQRVAASTSLIAVGPHEWVTPLRARPVRTSSSGVTYYEFYSSLYLPVPKGNPPAIYFCLDAVDPGGANTDLGNGTKVQIWQCTGTKNQLWAGSAVSGGSTLTNDDGGRCLDADSAPIQNGSQVQLWNCNGEPQQTWHSTGYLFGGEQQYAQGLTDPANGSPSASPWKADRTRAPPTGFRSRSRIVRPITPNSGANRWFRSVKPARLAGVNLSCDA